jgi:hypothetical protein
VPRPNFHGKEGVDGSSPSEGLPKVPANRHFVVVYPLNTRTHSGHICGTRDVPRRLAPLSDTNLASETQSRLSTKSLESAHDRMIVV